MQPTLSFQDVVPKQHPYCHLLEPAISLLPHIFDILPNDKASLIQTSIPLKMWCRQTKEGKPIFIYRFNFPTTPEEYLQIVQNFTLQKQVDSNIQEYRLYEQCKVDKTQIVYLSYKKVLIILPRYFIYVRYCFRIAGNIWLIGISDLTKPDQKGKTKGQILMSAIRISVSEGGCQVDVYSHVDMKINIKFQTAMNRGFFQIKKFMEKLYAKISKKI